MQAFSGKSGRKSYASGYGENKSFRKNSQQQIYFLEDLEPSKLIFLANNKLPLLNVFKLYNISLEKNNRPSGWTHECKCPLPNHKDDTPSFGYNSLEDRFNCFGCKRAGRAVEFISYVESESRIIVAKRILEKFDISTSDLSDIEIDDSYEKIRDILFGFSEYVRNFLYQHEFSAESTAFVQKISYVVDAYLYYSVNKSAPNLGNLQARIDKCKEMIEKYEPDIDSR